MLKIMPPESVDMVEAAVARNDATRRVSLGDGVFAINKITHYHNCHLIATVGTSTQSRESRGK